MYAGTGEKGGGDAFIRGKTRHGCEDALDRSSISLIYLPPSRANKQKCHQPSSTRMPVSPIVLDLIDKHCSQRHCSRRQCWQQEDDMHEQLAFVLPCLAVFNPNAATVRLLMNAAEKLLAVEALVLTAEQRHAEGHESYRGKNNVRRKDESGHATTSGASSTSGLSFLKSSTGLKCLWQFFGWRGRRCPLLRDRKTALWLGSRRQQASILPFFWKATGKRMIC